MKLKKIASLALAGVMAVSMLAGCSASTVEPETPVVPSVEAGVSDASADLYSKLNSAAKSKITFVTSGTQSDKLEKALESAAAYVGGSEVANIYDTPLTQVVTYQRYTTNSVSATGAGRFLAARVLVNGMSAENITNGSIAQQLAVLHPTKDNQEKDSLNVTLLFVVDGEVSYAAAMDQVAELLKSDLIKLPLNNDEVNSADESTLKYVYTGSAKATTITLGADHGKSATLIAVDVARGF